MRKADVPNQVILLNLAKCELTFYAAYYIISSLCFALYRLDHFDGKIPFDFETWLKIPDCCVHLSAEETVNFISMEVSFAVSGVVFAVVVRERVWDYALTVTVVHTALSCLVMLNFPLNWSWWVCYAVALVLMVVIGELVAVVVRWKFQGRVSPAPKDFDQYNGFLYRKS
ncbi:putative transmembrane protein 244 [Babylonia areolata]|uniref:putative transmembrane protein 244 n=1 Tax=Babylonia areolata TaxID=304850 RepID=UPI003FD4A2FE